MSCARIQSHPISLGTPERAGDDDKRWLSTTTTIEYMQRTYWNFLYLLYITNTVSNFWMISLSNLLLVLLSKFPALQAAIKCSSIVPNSVPWLLNRLPYCYFDQLHVLLSKLRNCAMTTKPHTNFAKFSIWASWSLTQRAQALWSMIPNSPGSASAQNNWSRFLGCWSLKKIWVMYIFNFVAISTASVSHQSERLSFFT